MGMSTLKSIRLSPVFKKIIALVITAAGIFGLYFMYWYFEKPYAAFGLLHGLFCFFSMALIATGLLLLVLSFLQLTKETTQQTATVFFTLIFSLFIAELALRALGVNKAYIESRNGKYVTAYVKLDKHPMLINEPHTNTFLIASEYRYPRHHNNYGFSDVDFVSQKKTDEIIVQTYGDSFTEGDGAPADSCYPAQLRQLINANANNRITIQNFGICGNDPGFYTKELKGVGQNFKPDILVLSYGSGDLNTDFLTRGGLERFKGDYWKGFDGPEWEWMYAGSYLFRLFANSLFDVSWLNFFLSPQQKADRIKQLEPKWNETFLQIAEVARQNNIRVLLLKKPERYEVDLNSYDNDFTFFETMADTIPVFKRMDLLPYYRDSLHMKKENSVQYYWPIDGHHNARGYSAMAKGVYAGLQRSYPEIFPILDSLKTQRE